MLASRIFPRKSRHIYILYWPVKLRSNKEKLFILFTIFDQICYQYPSTLHYFHKTTIIYYIWELQSYVMGMYLTVDNQSKTWLDCIHESVSNE